MSITDRIIREPQPAGYYLDKAQALVDQYQIDALTALFNVDPEKPRHACTILADKDGDMVELRYTVSYDPATGVKTQWRRIVGTTETPLSYAQTIINVAALLRQQEGAS